MIEVEQEKHPGSLSGFRFRVHDWSAHDLAPIVDLSDLKKKRKKIVLQIDGGGIKAIVPAVPLYALEERYGPIEDYVDTFWGTSSGAICVSAIATGALSARELLCLLVERGPLMFKRRVGGFLNPKNRSLYDSAFLRETLQTYFGDMTFLDLYRARGKRLNVSLVFIAERKTEIVNHETFPDLEIWKAVLGSSSAGVYFGPYELEYKNKKYFVCDGGTGVYNSLALKAAMHELFTNQLSPKKFFLLSMGAGRPDHATEMQMTEAELRKLQNGGISGMLHDAIWAMAFSSEETVVTQMEQLEYLKRSFKLDYHRFDIKHVASLERLDGTCNIKKLVDIAQASIKANNVDK